jgi:hypothetical protein
VTAPQPDWRDSDIASISIPIKLGHESLDVTLADLKGKDAESEEAQEHASSSSLALYASKLTTSTREISG